VKFVLLHNLFPRAHIQGGESTREEMCLSFAYYYPRTELGFCISTPSDKSFVSFVQETVRYVNIEYTTLYSILMYTFSNTVQQAKL